MRFLSAHIADGISDREKSNEQEEQDEGRRGTSSMEMKGSEEWRHKESNRRAMVRKLRQTILVSDGRERER